MSMAAFGSTTANAATFTYRIGFLLPPQHTTTTCLVIDSRVFLEITVTQSTFKSIG